jgi:hypothetical protein
MHAMAIENLTLPALCKTARGRDWVMSDGAAACGVGFGRGNEVK